MADSNSRRTFAGQLPSTPSSYSELLAGHSSDEDTESSCLAYGFLRGMDARALAVQLRFRNGNCLWFSYHCLLSWRFNPSVGLLLKFSGDVVSLVLIQGSNLDVAPDKSIPALTELLPRHRLTWVREMDEDELRQAGEGGPTIDRIDAGEFETVEEQKVWLEKRAPAFVSPSP